MPAFQASDESSILSTRTIDESLKTAITRLFCCYMLMEYMLQFTSEKHMATAPIKPVSQTHKRDIILLLAIPLGLLLLTAAYAYLPRVFATPSYDFLFMSCYSGWCEDRYTVSPDGKVRYIASPNAKDPSSAEQPTQLFLYDQQTDSTRAISSEEATSFHVDSSSRSPDGYTLKHDDGNSSMFLFFSSGREGGSYLQNGWLKKPVTLPDSSRYGYSGDIRFLGWVK